MGVIQSRLSHIAVEVILTQVDQLIATVPYASFVPNWKQKEKLHELCTFQLDYRVSKCAHDLQDADLLAKLRAGDLIVQEAKYHAKYLAFCVSCFKQVVIM